MSIILIAYGSDSTVTLSAPNADSHIDSHWLLLHCHRPYTMSPGPST